MSFVWGLLIFWSGAFCGMIGAALFATGRDSDEYDAHSDYDGRGR